MLCRVKFFIIFALTWISLEAKEAEDNENGVLERKRRVFSLFSVVTFPNEQCTGSSSTASTNVYGTCFSTSECKDKGGTADGNCAAGFGVCCTFLASACGSSVANNCTYIQSPGYPSAYTTAGTCKYSIYPASADICQLRLDLDTLTTLATAAGLCDGTNSDQMSITSGSGRNYQNLCGTLTGQHLYIETAQTTTAHDLTFTTVTASAAAKWRIKVSQIECYSTSRAPNDCLQYLTGISGSFQSFNHPSVIINPLSYTVCLRREAGYCAIDYSQASTSPTDSFQLGADDIAKNTPTIATVLPYVFIFGSSAEYYSGGTFTDDSTTQVSNADIIGGTIRAYGQPFAVEVNTAMGNTAISTGFNIVYNQVPCGAAGQARDFNLAAN